MKKWFESLIASSPMRTTSWFNTQRNWTLIIITIVGQSIILDVLIYTLLAVLVDFDLSPGVLYKDSMAYLSHPILLCQFDTSLNFPMSDATTSTSCWVQEDALQSGHRKKLLVSTNLHALLLAKTYIHSSSNIPDPLMHHGRHFGWVAFAFCNVKVLITNGLLSMAEEEPQTDETVQ
jgi:hypothetical protein